MIKKSDNLTDVIYHFTIRVCKNIVRDVRLFSILCLAPIVKEYPKMELYLGRICADDVIRKDAKNIARLALAGKRLMLVFIEVKKTVQKRLRLAWLRAGNYLVQIDVQIVTKLAKLMGIIQITQNRWQLFGCADNATLLSTGKIR